MEKTGKEYKENFYSSYLLDISKMLHSYRKHGMMLEYEYFLNSCSRKFLLRTDHLYILEISQWVRIIKYVKDVNLKNKYITITKSLIKKL